MKKSNFIILKGGNKPGWENQIRIIKTNDKINKTENLKEVKK